MRRTCPSCRKRRVSAHALSSASYAPRRRRRTLGSPKQSRRKRLRVLENQTGLPPITDPPPQSIPPDPTGSSRVIDLTHRGATWRITIELSLDPAIEDWLSLSDKAPTAKNAPREITLRMSLVHPFMRRFCRAESAEIEGLERVAAALALAEVTVRRSAAVRHDPQEREPAVAGGVVETLGSYSHDPTR